MDKNAVYGPIELPSGMKIKFRAPKGIDRVNVLKMQSIDEANVISGSVLVDTFVKAKCVVEIDGKPVDESYKTLLNDWFESDVNFFKMVVDNMFGAKNMQDEAKKMADFLLGKETSTDGCNAVTTPKED